MGDDLHTLEWSGASSNPPAFPDRAIAALIRDIAYPASAASVTALGSITAGTGFTSIGTVSIAPSGGTPTSGVSPADPSIVVPTSLKAISATVVSPGTGVSISDTFVPSGGTLQVAGPYGNGITTIPVASIFTVATAQLVGLALNAAGSAYAVSDTITLTGGTHSVAAVVTVLTESGGAIETFSITTPGSYTVETATFTQGSTSGSGTGATFKSGVWGALTFTVSTVGGYVNAPPLAANALANGATGSGTGVTATLVYGLGTALLTHGGNYSAAPSWTVTDSASGAGASIASGTLGGSGAAIPRFVAGSMPWSQPNWPTPGYLVQLTPNGQDAAMWTTIKTNQGFGAALEGATTLAAATFDALVIG